MGTGEANDTGSAPDEGSRAQRAKRRRRPYKYPTLERTSKEGRLEFTAPSHPGLRGWILDHESFDTIHLGILHSLGRRECPVHEVIPRFAHSNETRAQSALPLQQFLELVECLTISTSLFSPPPPSLVGPLRYGALRIEGEPELPQLRKLNEHVYNAAVEDFRQQWVAWCLSPLERDERFLREYQELLHNLTGLAALGRPLRYVLQESVASGAVLTLGGWSCVLPANWKARCPWQKSPSDWAEFLLAIKYGTHTRAIKERLTKANFEQVVCQAWRRYGEWLRDHPVAVADLERALGGLGVELRDANAASGEKTPHDLKPGHERAGPN